MRGKYFAASKLGGIGLTFLEFNLAMSVVKFITL